MKLTKLKVDGLYGQRNLVLTIEDNRLILVGENGTGKSTVANLLYFFLTQQWRRLKEFRFQVVEATVNDEVIRVTHEQVELLDSRAGRIRHYPYELRNVVTRHMLSIKTPVAIDELLNDRRLITSVARDLDIPVFKAREWVMNYLSEAPQKDPPDLQSIVEKLSRLVTTQFLYLPTYRRIEQDLRSIFSGLEIEEKIREFRARTRTQKATAFVELIEFGMEDVVQTIKERMEQIKEGVRTGLSNLTGTYLREVIYGKYGSANLANLRSVDPRTFGSIFARIDETTLPPNDKRYLQSKVAEFATAEVLEGNDEVIAHFLSKLVDLYKEQLTNERDVSNFVETCNRYLTGKEMVYDNLNYSIFIRQTEPQGKSERLELRMLSSGEKQIVSLFSQIYLSGPHNFFVVIDEPELSLSVPWQKRFLPDILNTGQCSGLVAVTHSPFIWENELEPYVKALADFFEPANVIH
jgi:predicted ATPase